MNIAWSIAGSDCSGGAGIQADLHTFQNMGVHGCSVITAITAQNSQGVKEVYYLSPQQVVAQIHVLSIDMPAKAIKLGMLGNSEIIEKLAVLLKDFSGKVILDPLLYSSSGARLFSSADGNYLTALKSLFPRIDLLTPNIPEAEFLLNRRIFSADDILQAAKDILKLGVRSVLIKGGHFSADALSQDYWSDNLESFWLCSQRADNSYHGTGCTLSAAIAGGVADGLPLRDSLVKAKMYLNRSIRSAYTAGPGAAYLAHAQTQFQSTDLPWLSSRHITETVAPFLDCGTTPLGLYPVVNRAYWLEKLLPLGITTIQLRIKDLQGNALTAEINHAVRLSKQYNARLFINDYWQQAIEYGAYGVHLGQGDLEAADLKKIRESGLRLGISTHCHYEIARAAACRPSYIAYGPIFATTSKIMPFMPQGLENLRQWRQTINLPVVAIGGINLERFPAVLATGISGVAMISAITAAAEPAPVVRSMLEMINGSR